MSLPGLVITDPRGQPAAREAGTWVLDEARTWLVRVPGAPCTATLDARPLPWDPAVGGLRLELPFAVGHLRLELRRDTWRWQVPLRVRPAPAKLDEATWMALLGELEAWLPGLAAGTEGPRVGQVGLQGVAAPLLVEALLPLLPALERALAAVLDQPRQRQQDHLHEVPLHRTRAADRETVAWLVRQPRTAAWLHPDKSLDLAGPPPTVRQRSTTDTLDHPANRHVAWLVDRVLRRLRQTAAGLRAAPGTGLNDDGAWARARARALDRAADRLDRRRKRSWLRAVRPQPASEGAMLVVLDHPVYAHLHRLARRVLAARFSLATGPQGAATRPSFTLYELWCLLAVHRVLAQALGPGVRWRASGLGRLLRLEGTGGGAQIACKANDLRVRLLFNPTFASLLTAPRSHGRVSLSKERRPDLVLAVRRGRQGRWLALDAKYRVGAAALGDAMASVHIYRDALRWPRYGGPATGGLLLVPRATADAAPWFDPAFHSAHHLGVLALCPGRPVPPPTRRALCALLEQPWP